MDRVVCFNLASLEKSRLRFKPMTSRSRRLELSDSAEHSVEAVLQSFAGFRQPQNPTLKSEFPHADDGIDCTFCILCAGQIDRVSKSEQIDPS